MNLSAQRCRPPLRVQPMVEHVRVARPPAFVRGVLLAPLLALMLAACATPVRDSGRATAQQTSAERASSERPTAEAPTPEPPVAEPAATPAHDKAQVPLFSTAKPGDQPPPGWQSWVLHPSKRKTRYAVIQDADAVVVRAAADASASGLITPMDVDLRKSPVLEWRWRAQSLVADADNAVAATEDAPLRLVLAFDGDKSTLSLRERLFAERVRLISGREMPYASLMYIWENNKPKESLIPNPHTDRVRKLVVDTGPARLGQWRIHRRNVLEDYERAFGKLPGRLLAIGIMTDTDNTGGQVAAYYGDIRLLPVEAAAPRR